MMRILNIAQRIICISAIDGFFIFFRKNVQIKFIIVIKKCFASTAIRPRPSDNLINLSQKPKQMGRAQFLSGHNTRKR